MSDRQRLPWRRCHEIIEFELEGVGYIASAGHCPNGSLGEIFFHGAGKPGSSIERFAADSAVLCSLALQHGATMQEIRHSLVKLKDGSGAGPVGRLLDLIEADHAGSGVEQHGCSGEVK